MATTVNILTLENEIEAKLLSDILSERSIPHVIRSYHDSAYDGLFQVHAGWGHIEAPEDYRDQILDIYGEMSTQNGNTTNEE
jgi:hypothetical protein